MLTIIEHLKNRYLGQKAQGMVEYALILAFVVAIAGYFSTTDGVGDAIKGVMNSVMTALGSTKQIQ